MAMKLGGFMRFAVVLHTDDGVSFGVTVPDLPGCFSAGDTLDDALDSAREAIDLHLKGMTDDGESVPSPLPLSVHRDNPDYADGIWAVVDIDVSRYEGKAEKINITLPRNLIHRIDDFAKSRGLSRSGFLAESARQAMHR